MTKEFLQKTALVFFSIIFAFLLSEIMYRSYVVLSQPKKIFDSNLTATIFSDSFVNYDAIYGYSYNPQKEFYRVRIVNNKATACSCPYTTNEFGTFETDVSDFKAAQENTVKRGPRILVFGDSFTSIPYNGETWVSLFSKRFKEKLDPNVQVLNFGRDGYGIAQMIELAAGQIDKWKPDIILFAFITADFQRWKFWRKIVKTQGSGGWYVAFDPNEDEKAFDSQWGQLMDQRITKQWCEKVMKNGGYDPLIASMASFNKKMRDEELNKNRAGFFMPQSFLFNRLVYGQPVIRRSKFQGKKLSFLNDANLKAAIKKLNQSGIPYYFVHLPMLSEMEKHFRWLPSSDDLRLAHELFSMTGLKQFLFLGDYLHLSTEQLARFPMSPEDAHPSEDGIRYYADAMINLYLDKEKIGMGTDLWTVNGKEARLAVLINRSPLFDSRDDWGPGLAQAVGYGPGVIVGPGADDPAALSQQFPAQPNAVFKIVARALAPQAVDVLKITARKSPKKAVRRFLKSLTAKVRGRFQINWTDSKGKFVSSFIESFETTSDERTFETYVIAPENAFGGTLYAVADGSNMVRYTEMSLFGQMPPSKM